MKEFFIMKNFILETKWQKCVTVVEQWQKDDLIIERAQLWRFGEVFISAPYESDVKKLLKKRDAQDRVCLSDLFEEIQDETLRDCISDDLYFPDEMPEKETKRLQKLFSKDPEAMFEKERWEIEETKLYFESEITIKAQK